MINEIFSPINLPDGSAFREFSIYKCEYRADKFLVELVDGSISVTMEFPFPHFIKIVDNANSYGIVKDIDGLNLNGKFFYDTNPSYMEKYVNETRDFDCKNFGFRFYTLFTAEEMFQIGCYEEFKFLFFSR